MSCFAHRLSFCATCANISRGGGYEQRKTQKLRIARTCQKCQIEALRQQIRQRKERAARRNARAKGDFFETVSDAKRGRKRRQSRCMLCRSRKDENPISRGKTTLHTHRLRRLCQYETSCRKQSAKNGLIFAIFYKNSLAYFRTTRLLSSQNDTIKRTLCRNSTISAAVTRVFARNLCKFLPFYH